MCTVCLKMCVEESVFNSFWELPVSVTVFQYLHVIVCIYVCVMYMNCIISTTLSTTKCMECYNLFVRWSRQ